MSIKAHESDSPVSSVKLGSTTHDEAMMVYHDYNGDGDDDQDEYDLDYDDLDYMSEGKRVYDDGWLYPICIGDNIRHQAGHVLQDRYQISRRLGWGCFSTVWLAEDLKLIEAVALEILDPETLATGSTTCKRLLPRRSKNHPVFSCANWRIRSC